MASALSLTSLLLSEACDASNHSEWSRLYLSSLRCSSWSTTIGAQWAGNQTLRKSTGHSTPIHSVIGARRGCILALDSAFALGWEATLTKLEVGLLHSAAGDMLNLEAACRSSSYTGCTQNWEVSNGSIPSSNWIMCGWYNTGRSKEAMSFAKYVATLTVKVFAKALVLLRHWSGSWWVAITSIRYPAMSRSKRCTQNFRGSVILANGQWGGNISIKLRVASPPWRVPSKQGAHCQSYLQSLRCRCNCHRSEGRMTTHLGKMVQIRSHQITHKWERHLEEFSVDELYIPWSLTIPRLQGVQAPSRQTLPNIPHAICPLIRLDFCTNPWWVKANCNQSTFFCWMLHGSTKVVVQAVALLFFLIRCRARHGSCDGRSLLNVGQTWKISKAWEANKHQPNSKPQNTNQTRTKNTQNNPQKKSEI